MIGQHVPFACHFHLSSASRWFFIERAAFASHSRWPVQPIVASHAKIAACSAPLRSERDPYCRMCCWMPSLTQLRYQLSEGFFSFVALAADPDDGDADDASANEPASSGTGVDVAAGVTHTQGSKVPDAVQTCAPLAPVVQVHGELAPVTHCCCRLHAIAPKQKNKTNDAIACRFVAFISFPPSA